MSKVVGLRGKVVDERVPRPDVIEACERMLDEARSGEIIGLTAVKAYHDAATGNVRVGWQSYTMIGRMEDLKAQMLRDLE